MCVYVFVLRCWQTDSEMKHRHGDERKETKRGKTGLVRKKERSVKIEKNQERQGSDKNRERDKGQTDSPRLQSLSVKL